MPSPPEDRIRERAHELAREMGVCQPFDSDGTGHSPNCDAIVAFALAERAATWEAAAFVASAEAGACDKDDARDASAIESCQMLARAFEARAREAAPVTPGKGTP